jgi:hypothetical protein
MPKKERPEPKADAECFFCSKYLAEKKKTRASSSGISDIHIIDVY